MPKGNTLHSCLFFSYLKVASPSTEDNQHQEHNSYNNTTRYYTSEIVEEGEEIITSGDEEELFEIGQYDNKVSRVELDSIREIEEIERSSLFSFDVNCENNFDGENCVYVGVGKSESSVDALSWTLKTLVGSSSSSSTSTNTIIYLVHIFPEVHSIPSPLGKIPKSQVSREQVENYMAQERGKRRELLQKFIDMCSASNVKVDTVLIESDAVAKALLDLIPVLNMRKLVLGINKSNLRKLKSKRGNGIVDQVVQKAPEYCEIKVICEGKQVNDQTSTHGSPSPRVIDDDVASNKSLQFQDQSTTNASGNDNNNNNDSFACMCFKSPRVAG